MNELIIRLRNRVIECYAGHGVVMETPDEDCFEAAEALETLSAEFDQLSGKLRDVSSDLNYAIDALRWYADQMCEHSTDYEGCGKLSDDDCGGCKARAFVSKMLSQQ